MSTEIVTPEDLQAFKEEMLDEIKKIVADTNPKGHKKWYKSWEVRELLDISPGTLQNLRINGTLPFSKVGGMMFYDWDDIKKMFDDSKTVVHQRFR